ncbi:GDP-L-fucose synthase [Allochromatium palmeri]|uniref:GDP-L-fucose synthase n=1 Tax=Allochromatium palmeri TaxID=231048 RepID=A0A6N8ELI8_9GAMM|nr:GDP-L-fucose synthase [Allochromatium palmeri]MTW23204.1 NAD-dependent epimerase/dehydratase family protein [Allochromatium palmeri]
MLNAQDLSPSIYIAGHRGMVGAALVRALERAGYTQLITRTHAELDLTDQTAVETFFADQRPTQVYLAAAKVGGIHANDTYPAEFLYQNLLIEANIIQAAWRHGVERLLFLGSSCIYPRLAPQPMPETALLTGPLEPTNEAYAIAKIAGIKLCESYNRQYGTDFRSVMPTNLYGPGDNFDLANSHVLPALIRKFHQAKLDAAPSVTVWGSGTPRREFLHVDDMAAACLHVMDLDPDTWRTQVDPRCSHLNVGTGVDVTIAELAHMVAEVVGFQGQLVFDPSKPDGTPRKLLDVTRLRDLGWTAAIDLTDGIRQTYHWFLEHQGQIRL